MNYCRFIISLTFFLAICVWVTPTQAESDSDSARLTRINEMYEADRHEFPDIAEVCADTLRQWLKSGDVVLVDVRKAHEREISGIPRAILAEDLTVVILAANHRVVFYCTIGYRSGKAVQKLQEKGIHAYNLKGGILAWAHVNGPIEHKGIPTKTIHVYGKKWNLLPESHIAVW